MEPNRVLLYAGSIALLYFCLFAMYRANMGQGVFVVPVRRRMIFHRRVQMALLAIVAILFIATYFFRMLGAIIVSMLIIHILYTTITWYDLEEILQGHSLSELVKRDLNDAINLGRDMGHGLYNNIAIIEAHVHDLLERQDLPTDVKQILSEILVQTDATVTETKMLHMQLRRLQGAAKNN